MAKDDIFLLIEKYIKNAISLDELMSLNKLLENNENAEIFKNLIKDNYQLKTKKVSFDTEESFKRTESKIKIIGSNKRIQIRPLYKYAVAASVIILVSLTIYFKTQNQKIQYVDPVIVNTEIKPGTAKATLTLEDGSQVVLEKGEAFQTQNANSNGEELVYIANQGKIKEVQYNYLTIPRGGQYFVKLSDGTKVWLNSESKLKYPIEFINGFPREVELVYGEAYFDVSPSVEHNGSTFKVVNQSQEVEVFGTEFNIKAYKDETNIYTTLVEGKVTIGDKINQKLTPNHQSILNKETKEFKIAEVDVNSETSWRRGVFSFKGKPLKDIMKVISRWYNVDVIFANKELELIKFKGNLNKDLSIERILSLMLSAELNSYEIKNKKIILR